MISEIRWSNGRKVAEGLNLGEMNRKTWANQPMVCSKARVEGSVSFVLGWQENIVLVQNLQPALNLEHKKNGSLLM